MPTFSPKWLRHPAAAELLDLAEGYSSERRPSVPARLLINDPRISSRWERKEAATVLQALAQYGYLRRQLSSKGTMEYRITTDGMSFRQRLALIPPCGLRAAVAYWQREGSGRGLLRLPVLALLANAGNHLTAARSFATVQSQRLEPGLEHQGTPEAATADGLPSAALDATPLPPRPVSVASTMSRETPALPGPVGGTFG